MVSLLFVPAIADAHDIPSIVNNLPRTYAGGFAWKGMRAIQMVQISFASVVPLDGGMVEVLGCGHYDAGSKLKTDIKVKMHVAVPSLQIELWESSPIGSASFTVDGSHVGRLTDDLQTITAEWTTRGTRMKGDLNLKRGTEADALSCVPPTPSTVWNRSGTGEPAVATFAASASR